MPPNIKILVLESNEADVELIRHRLRKAKINFEIRAVINKASYSIELDAYQPDVILANHRVKDMDAKQALKLSNKKKYQIPFILVTDKVDELFAVEMMKSGATDYLLKENISKLPQTIKLALNNAETLLKKREESQSDILQKSLSRNAAFLNAIPDLIFLTNRFGVITDFKASREMEPFVSPEHFLGKSCAEVLPAPIASEILINITIALEGGKLPVHEYQLPYPDGVHEFEARYAAVTENEVLTIVRDITFSKQAEQKILKE